MKPALFLIALLVAAGCASGCTYTEDRLNDLTDICQAKLSFGQGVALSGRALWPSLGLGYSDSASVGFGYRGYGVWKSVRTDVQVVLPYINTEDEFENIAGNIEMYGVGDPGLVGDWPIMGEELHFERLAAEDSYESYLRLGLTAQFVVGGDMELRPVEFVDFVLGLFTLDFRDDDTVTP